MIAAIGLIRRQEKADAATFRRHWLEVHGPLVGKFAGLRHTTPLIFDSEPACVGGYATQGDLV
jgi:hypothetical protein